MRPRSDRRVCRTRESSLKGAPRLMRWIRELIELRTLRATIDTTGAETTSFESVQGIRDPFIRRQYRSNDGDRPSQVISEYAPAPQAPSTYPSWLPFLPNRAVFVTESPSGTVAAGARWPCKDPEQVLATLVEASARDGWQRLNPQSLPESAPPSQVELSRGSFARRIFVARVERKSLVQLIDIPSEGRAR